MAKNADRRWARSDLELMVLLSIGFLGGAAYGAALHRVFEAVNRVDREVPAVYGYLRRAEAQGFVLSTWDREGGHNIRRYTLTGSGRSFLNDRLEHLRKAGKLTKDVLGEAGVQKA